MRNNSIGDLIKTKRLERNWSITRLAKEIRVSRVYMSNIENNRRIPSSKIYDRLEKALNLESGYRSKLLNEKYPILERDLVYKIDSTDILLGKNYEPVTKTASTIALELHKYKDAPRKKVLEKGIKRYLQARRSLKKLLNHISQDTNHKKES